MAKKLYVASAADISKSLLLRNDLRDSRIIIPPTRIGEAIFSARDVFEGESIDEQL